MVGNPGSVYKRAQQLAEAAFRYCDHGKDGCQVLVRVQKDVANRRGCNTYRIVAVLHWLCHRGVRWAPRSCRACCGLDRPECHRRLRVWDSGN